MKILKTINNKIILREIPENKTIKGIIIPQQLAANRILFAKIIKLPNTKLDNQLLQEGQLVILGFSPIWEKKFTYKLNKDKYIIVDEYAIIGIIDVDKAIDLIDIDKFNSIE